MNRRVLATFVAFSLVVVACGDDDDNDSDPTTDTTVVDDEGGDGEDAAGDFCTAYAELVAGEPGPDQIRAVAEVAPDAAKTALETIATGFETDEEFFATEEFSTAFAVLGSAAADECADEELAVTAVDYGYEGIDAELAAGVYGVELTNDGTEMHELAILRKNEGVTQSFEEILDLGEEESAALVTNIGIAFATPGTTAPGLFDLSEPGDYLAICFIPVGTTPEAGEGSGPPHFTEGMLREFTVS